MGPDGKFVTIPEYPEFAWTEGLVNAVTHRDYSITGQHINVNVLNKEVLMDYAGKDLVFYDEPNGEYVSFADMIRSGMVDVWKDPCLTYDDMIAVVGSRKSSIYGLDAAKYLSREICRVGYGVVSGVAYGIDTAAHKEVLICGGKTIGVLGCGLDIIYPKSNKKLYEEIYNNGRKY